MKKRKILKIFRFAKKVFFIRLTILSNFTNANSLSCISMNNHDCKTRAHVINVNVFFPFSIETSKCTGSCNNINYPYAKICVPNIIKKLNVKVFNLMSKTNETKLIEWHETCKCECKFGENVFNNKQRWNKNKCRCECKELIDKGVCGKGFIWNPNNFECECDKAFDVDEYLDYESCKCIKKLVDKLVDECTETIEEVKLAKITLAENENSYKCSSCTVYIVLMIVFFAFFTGITTYFVYCNCSLIKNNVSCIKFGIRKETKIW